MNVYQRALQETARQLVAIDHERVFTIGEIPIRELDWQDVKATGGISLRYDLQQIRERQSEDMRRTNERDIYGYPCMLVIALGERTQMLDEVPEVMEYLEKARKYFHNRRRMAAVWEKGCTQVVCTMTPGPQVPDDLKGIRVITRTIWAWFLESRETANYV